MADRPESVIAGRQRLAAAMRAAWGGVSGLLVTLRRRIDSPDADPGWMAASSIAEAIAGYDRMGRALLLEPLEEFERVRPIRRTLGAIEDFDREGGDDAVAASARRARLDARMQFLLGQALLSLKDPWLLAMSGPNNPHRAARTARWNARLERFERQAASLLSRYDAWAAAARPLNPASQHLIARHERHLAFWWRLQRSIAAHLEVTAGVCLAGGEILMLAQSTGERIGLERQDLLRAVEAQIHYLEGWDGGSFDPPEIKARIATREERAEQWWSRCSAILEQRLPESLERFEGSFAVPGFLHRALRVAPRAVFREAILENARLVFQSQFAAVMERHLGIAQEIERAGEVIRYALEASRAGEGDLVPEALKNVIERLRERAEAENEPRHPLALDAARVIVSATREAGQSAFRRPALLFTFRAGRRGAAMLRRGRAGAAGQAESLAAGFVQHLVQGYDDFLIRVGWKAAVRVPMEPVIARPDLGQALNLGSGRRGLPALYLRLFRLAPVEDPRFLIGREEELSGFRQALHAWREGRYAACLLVGARGSGKTSLLNCSLPEVFAAESVVRSQFRGRIVSPLALEQFLSSLLGGSPGQPLGETLAASRRVIVLEEVERIFLKCFGGFAAARRLLEIMQSSASTTLWILVLNTHAQRMLEQSVGWDAYFSHTINSMSVWREDLERAILQRHNLSGLKLAFAAPKEHGLRARLGFRTNPQEAFFNALYEQSGGNFRSAFELWQSSIDYIEGGTIHMSQPLSPSLEGLRRQLRQDDHFTLHSILQHGSLTAGELAQVLMEPEPASRLRLERLAAMGIIEPDPEHPGLRVDPEAQRFVHSTLQSVNLL
jgi:hypothetical protein